MGGEKWGRAHYFALCATPSTALPDESLVEPESLDRSFGQMSCRLPMARIDEVVPRVCQNGGRHGDEQCRRAA